jgi:hypothetical protein
MSDSQSRTAFFDPPQVDFAIAQEAAQALLDEANSSSEWDSGTVGNALDRAADAFPGFRNFVEELPDDKEPGIYLSANRYPGMLCSAAAKMAVVGAVGEMSGGFDWQGAEDCVELCRAALAPPGPVPG